MVVDSTLAADSQPLYLSCRTAEGRHRLLSCPYRPATGSKGQTWSWNFLPSNCMSADPLPQIWSLPGPSAWSLCLGCHLPLPPYLLLACAQPQPCSLSPALPVLLNPPTCLSPRCLAMLNYTDCPSSCYLCLLGLQNTGPGLFLTSCGIMRKGSFWC